MGGMAAAITIRNVPEAVRDELAARASRSGRSLQEYLAAELTALASRPAVEDVIASSGARVRAAGRRLDPETILAARDTERH